MDGKNMQHGVDWIGDKSDGYIATEKYNGGRATPSMRFMVFDCPSVKGNYLDRLKAAKKYEGGPLKVVPGKTIAGLNEARILLTKIVKRRGEGLILREPDIKYKAGRTSAILKFKPILAGQ